MNFIAVLATRQRFVTRRNHRPAYFDPMVHLPNLRALNRFENAMVSALLFACSGHGTTGKNYGIMLRIQYKQKLSQWITPLLEQDEHVYQLSGNDLVLRFNTESHQERIEARQAYQTVPFYLGWHAFTAAGGDQFLLCPFSC